MRFFKTFLPGAVALSMFSVRWWHIEHFVGKKPAMGQSNQCRPNFDAKWWWNSIVEQSMIGYSQRVICCFSRLDCAEIDRVKFSAAFPSKKINFFGLFLIHQNGINVIEFECLKYSEKIVFKLNFQFKIK
jgi:hypothetical protein